MVFRVHPQQRGKKMDHVRGWMKPSQKMAMEFLELIEEKLAYYRKEFPNIYDITEDVADYLFHEIRKEFDVIKRETPTRFLFLSEDASSPECRGCFNEFGGCGTPCVNCDDAEDYRENWEILMWVPDKFRVLERKVQSSNTKAKEDES